MATKFRDLANEALDAFWDVIVQKFPQATTGDLSPLTTIRLDTAAETAIDEWVGNNVPESPTPRKHTPGPWFVDRVSPHSPICIKPYPGRIVCDIEGTDAESEANALLIAAAPALLDSLESIIELAQSVAGNWENPTLADAVRNLDRVAGEAALLVQKARHGDTSPPAMTAA